MRTPLPPLALRERAGARPPGADPGRHYEEQGVHHRRRIEELLGADWTWQGKRVLDFGCGAGRTLRHLLDVAARDTEVWGCDIAEASVEWLRGQLCPPLHVFLSSDDPPLPRPDRYFDVIWALSVFTHIHRNWAEWLLELHRVLADDGRLLLTFLNEGMLPLWDEVTGGAPWEPDRLGIAPFRTRAPWEQGGPIVFLSEWWIRAHWGRAFEIERLSTHGFGPGGQGYAVLRKRPARLSSRDLRRAEPGEARERAAASWVRRQRALTLLRALKSRMP